MSLTVRNVVEHLYRYLRKEQRELPLTDPDLDDPLPEALAAINGTLQELAVRAPQFATKRLSVAYFQAPASVAVSGLTRGGFTVTATWPTGAAGNIIQLPGDPNPNRILFIADGIATLLYPHLSEAVSGTATIQHDSVDLPADLITVFDPVRVRGGGIIRPANGRVNQQMPLHVSDDFGRRWVTTPRCDAAQAYFVDTFTAPGAAFPQHRLTLRSAPSADLVLEFQAKFSFGAFTQEDVFRDTAIPMPAEFTESIFLPLALFRFFSSSVMRNNDAPKFVAEQVKTANLLLAAMHPQGRKPSRLYPGL
ncbi:MAG: hypothetical protein V4672_12970 [Verrucomicrobiota bacterium]